MKLVQALFVSCATAQDLFLATQPMKLMESEVGMPAGWQSSGSSPDSLTLELVFAVKQQNVESLVDEVLAVSSPDSPRYGKHLSNQEVHDLVAPAQSDINAVLTFLESHGLQGRKVTPNGDMVAANVPVRLAETMLSTKYEVLHHESTNLTLHRTPSGYSLPGRLAAAVDFVSPTVHVSSDRQPLKAELGDTSNQNVPKALRELYSMQNDDSSEVIGKADKNKMAVTAFLKQYYKEADLQSFWSKYCSGITCGDDLPKLVGDATTGSAGVESMLDIDTITGMVGGIEAEFWGYAGSSPDNPENEPFMKWLSAVSSTPDDDVPLVFSTSYGEDENSWSVDAANRLNTEFMKAGARGISLLYASGDEGANCKSGKYVPETPSSSPWVTAVGGTAPASGFPAPGSETAIGLSSGGFSDYFAMPDYQKSAVQAYLSKSGLPSTSKYGVNVSGRAYPDIAAQATNFCVPPFGCGIAGTSCATPTASGIIAALNDARLAAGKTSLGFLNPLLYSLAGTDSFQDITTGSSSGCLFSSGWPATEGWDAVTGLGTLNYKNMVKAILALP
jgi:tripeptidyl-peptidase-1